MEVPDFEMLPALQQSCAQIVTTVFPDICPAYLEQMMENNGQDASIVLNEILDYQADGMSYPKELSSDPGSKRKRSNDDDRHEEFKRKRRMYEDPSRHSDGNHEDFKMILVLLTKEFPNFPRNYIQQVVLAHRQLLFPSYRVLHQEFRNKYPPANKNIHDRISLSKGPRIDSSPNSISREYSTHKYIPGVSPNFDNIRKELLFVRQVCAADDEDACLKRQISIEKSKAFELAKASGNTQECECCFAECSSDNLVSCDADISHVFCIDCARRQAETLVGLSKYNMTCMSTDGCEANFRVAERKKFISDSLGAALDRIEQLAVLRIAGLEDLVTCPFCPFAAEYPPIEQDKEFRCLNPSCKLVSCRLCRLKTHIPKTCTEAAGEKVSSSRQRIEEAMSTAMIRKCNKCGTPFIRESGCNKMTCFQAGCNNVQCYVCSQNCTYKHFNDPTRGGKLGNCPLFEDVAVRHYGEVKRAAAEATKLETDGRPDIDPHEIEVSMPAKRHSHSYQIKSNMMFARADGRIQAINGNNGPPMPLGLDMPVLKPENIPMPQIFRKEEHQGQVQAEKHSSPEKRVAAAPLPHFLSAPVAAPDRQQGRLAANGVQRNQEDGDFKKGSFLGLGQEDGSDVVFIGQKKVEAALKSSQVNCQAHQNAGTPETHQGAQQHEDLQQIQLWRQQKMLQQQYNLQQHHILVQQQQQVLQQQQLHQQQLRQQLLQQQPLQQQQLYQQQLYQQQQQALQRQQVLQQRPLYQPAQQRQPGQQHQHGAEKKTPGHPNSQMHNEPLLEIGSGNTSQTLERYDAQMAATKEAVLQYVPAVDPPGNYIVHCHRNRHDAPVQSQNNLERRINGGTVGMVDPQRADAIAPVLPHSEQGFSGITRGSGNASNVLERGSNNEGKLERHDLGPFGPF